jgi:hypothetical protein
MSAHTTVGIVALFVAACGGSTAADGGPTGIDASMGGAGSGGSAGSGTGGAAGSSGGAGSPHDASTLAETGAGGDASADTGVAEDASEAASDAASDAPSVLGTCVYGDAASCPSGYDCACGGPGVGQCECHKKCQSAGDCDEPNAMCGCSATDPHLICVSACFCFCD